MIQEWLIFLLKHLDCELIKLLETSVPPCDLMLVSGFRTALQKHAKQAASPRSVNYWLIVRSAPSFGLFSSSTVLPVNNLPQVQDERMVAEEKRKKIHVLRLQVGSRCGCRLVPANAEQDRYRSHEFGGTLQGFAGARQPTGVLTKNNFNEHCSSVAYS